MRTGYFSDDTIAALSTQTGGALSVVRMSGTQSSEILQKVSRSAAVASFEPRKLKRTDLYGDQGEQLDDALVVRFISPASYTGEDMVEFHIHGSSFIAHRLLETLMSLGARQALPGEFSFRAVRNGKMNLFEAQAVADLIAASNQTAVSLALEKLSGSQTQILQELGALLRKVAVLGELGIDFADQDIDEVSLPSLRKQLAHPMKLLEGLKNSYSRGLRVQEGVRVALVGLPNAGKSSFFNALLGEDRSIVSSLAGTTRDVIGEKLILRGKNQTVTLCLEDTAGLRTTNHPVEKIGIERTQGAAKNADLILFVLDPTASSQLALEQWLVLKNKAPSGSDLTSKTLGILTKSDLFNSGTSTDPFAFKSPFASMSSFTSSLASSFGIQKWVLTSAQTGSGLTEAAEAIIEFCGYWTQRKAGEIVLTRMDHFAAVIAALEHLERAMLAPELDLFAADIRQALDSLGPLIGETPADDILGAIFSDFCIGK